MEPDQNSRTDDGQPLFQAPFTQPFQQPVVSGGPAGLPDQQPVGGPRRSSSKVMILLAVAASIQLLVIIGLSIGLLANSDPPPAPSQTPAANQASGDRPAAATATSLQSANDDISQNISSLNDDKDFAADKLSDKTLGL